MENKKSINFEIGFADSEIVSFHSQDEDLIIFLKCWNELMIKLKFLDCIFFSIQNGWKVSDICEAENPKLMKDTLLKTYEKVPLEHPYKLFQFLNDDGDPSVEIICKNIFITKDM